MKKKNVMLFVATIVLLGMTACKEEPIYTPEHIPVLEIIKFKQPEYKNHIMVLSPNEIMQEQNRTKMWTSGFVLPDSVFKAHGQDLFGQSPYIELVDDYLLIDWRWSRIYYQNREAILKETWSDFHSFEAEWTLDEILVDRPVAELYYLDPKKLSEYAPDMNYAERLPDLMYQYFDLEQWSKTDQDTQIGWMNITNAEYAKYPEALNNMISEGKLDEYAQKVKLRK